MNVHRYATATLLALAALTLGGCGFLAVPAPPPPPDNAQAPGAQSSNAQSPSPASVPAQPQAQANSATVQPGETLYQIARRNNVPIRAVIDANRLEPPYVLRPGQQLVIPHPQVHVVAAGETLYGVARHYGVDTSTLVRTNGLTPPYNLLVGQQLILPSQVTPIASRPSATAAPSEVRRVELLPPQPVPAATVPSPPEASATPAPSAPKGIAATPLPPPPKPAPLPERVVANVPPPLQAPTPVPVAAPLPAPVPKPAIEAAAPAETPVAAPAVASSGSPAGHFLWPVKGKILSGFGPKEGGLFNDGINIAVPRGQTVVAADGGVVVYAGNEIRGFGNLVLIKHANGWMTAYAHNEELLVHRGEQVQRGQAIAKAGSSGGVASPQVHFEVRRGSRAVDPTKYLAQLAS